MSLQQRMIAVVDDDPRLLESLEDLLESAGYLACCFSTARALLTNGLADVDAVITDIGLPGIDGFELRERVREVRPDLPVFLITGRHEIADQERSRDAWGFFRKPFNGQDLLMAVENALRDRTSEGGS